MSLVKKIGVGYYDGLKQKAEKLGIELADIISDLDSGKRTINSCPLTDEKIKSFHAETTRKLAVEFKNNNNYENQL